MLKIKRKVGETIVIVFGGQHCVMKVTDNNRRQICFGFEADKSVRILRGELMDGPRDSRGIPNDIHPIGLSSQQVMLIREHLSSAEETPEIDRLLRQLPKLGATV